MTKKPVILSCLKNNWSMDLDMVWAKNVCDFFLFLLEIKKIEILS